MSFKTIFRTLNVAILFAAVFIGHRSACAAPSSPATATPAQVQVDLFRGLADVFSRGMDTLGHTLQSRGYAARVYSTKDWPTAASRIAAQYANRHKVIIVLIGHSLGGNAVFNLASELDKQNIPVELIVSFDATEPRPVPKNVLHVVNFYQQNGFGKRVTAGPGFNGELSNIDLTADTGIRHTTIEKSPRLHAMVMQKIADVVNKDLANRLAAGKKKSKKPKPAKTNAGQAFLEGPCDFLQSSQLMLVASSADGRTR